MTQENNTTAKTPDDELIVGGESHKPNCDYFRNSEKCNCGYESPKADCCEKCIAGTKDYNFECDTPDCPCHHSTQPRDEAMISFAEKHILECPKSPCQCEFTQPSKWEEESICNPCFDNEHKECVDKRCECKCIPDRQESWEERFDRHTNLYRKDYIGFESGDCWEYGGSDPFTDWEKVKSFIRQVEKEAEQRGYEAGFLKAQQKR